MFGVFRPDPVREAELQLKYMFNGLDDLSHRRVDAHAREQQGAENSQKAARLAQFVRSDRANTHDKKWEVFARAAEQLAQAVEETGLDYPPPDLDFLKMSQGELTADSHW